MGRAKKAECSAKKNSIEKWAEYVRAYHEKHGTPPEGNLVSIVATALLSLHFKGRPRKISRYDLDVKWKIF